MSARDSLLHARPDDPLGWRERVSRTPQDDVREFHEALDIPVAMTPKLRRPELRAALIEEEARETCEAIRNGDLIGAIDGLCDILCVVYGAALEFGIDLDPFWQEVHRTNMAKVGGPVREDGKRLKPEGWTPPDLARVLRELKADRKASA
jgi:predicted HAD superfamily Cof-like phosphohydrolase